MSGCSHTPVHTPVCTHLQACHTTCDFPHTYVGQNTRVLFYVTRILWLPCRRPWRPWAGPTEVSPSEEFNFLYNLLPLIKIWMLTKANEGPLTVVPDLSTGSNSLSSLMACLTKWIWPSWMAGFPGVLACRNVISPSESTYTTVSVPPYEWDSTGTICVLFI